MSFQFTHPGKGATRPTSAPRRTIVSFNSRTPGGVRHAIVAAVVVLIKFQFTHPGRGATDTRRWKRSRPASFNSRTPGGVRHNKRWHTANRYTFQFTPPGRGATRLWRTGKPQSLFQFTHPGRGATAKGIKSLFFRYSFNSRTPGGVRPHELTAYSLRR